MQLQPNELIELLKLSGIARPEEDKVANPDELGMPPMPEPSNTMPDDSQDDFPEVPDDEQIMVFGDVKEDEEDEDIQNGYNQHHAMDPDAYGDDNPESTTNDRDENPIEVSESAFRDSDDMYDYLYQALEADPSLSPLSDGDYDFVINTIVKMIQKNNAEDSVFGYDYATDTGPQIDIDQTALSLYVNSALDYVSKGTEEDTGPSAKQIHESLVYKYREFKKKVNESEDEPKQMLYMVSCISNFWGGKYYEQSLDSIFVLASSSEEAVSIAQNNQDAVLTHFKNKRYTNGKPALRKQETVLKVTNSAKPAPNQLQHPKVLQADGTVGPVNLR